MRVLLIEDHGETRTLLARALEREGHATSEAGTLAEARDRFAERPPDVVVLDLGMPDGDGLTLCREWRRAGVLVPILVLTAQGAVARRVEGLDAGADDFLAKPFAVAELRARVRALGRRGPMARSTVRTVGDATLDLSARKATRGTEEIPLTAREWALVELLAAREGRVATRGEILESVWGEDSPQAGASLEVIVARVRKKLGAGVLRTVRGEGYALGE